MSGLYDEDGIDGPFERGMAKPIQRGRTLHMRLDIRGCLMNWSARQMKGMFKHDDGREMTGEEAKAQLLEELASGKDYLPVGECEGFDFKTGCPGHETAASPAKEGR